MDHKWKQLILVVNFLFGLRVNEIPNKTFILDSHRPFIYNVHCPNSGPHFTPYRTYTTVAFLYREKNSAPVVHWLCCIVRTFTLAPSGTHDPGIIFLLLLKRIVRLGIIFFPVKVNCTFFLSQDVILRPTST